MKNALNLLSLLCLLFFVPTLLKGQCDIPIFHSYAHYNENTDEITLHFRPENLSEVGPINNVYNWRAIQYRVFGTTEWEVAYDYITDSPPFEPDYYYTIRNLDRCKLYEYRFTCSTCVTGFPALVFSDPCKIFLDGEIEDGRMNEIHRESTDAHPSDLFAPVTNLRLLSTNLADNTIELAWDPRVGDSYYRVKITNMNCNHIMNTNVPYAIMEACEYCDYNLAIVNAYYDCGGWAYQSQGVSLQVPFGECTAKIDDITPGTYNAYLTWSPLNGDPDEYLLEYYKDNVFIASLTTKFQDEFISPLEPVTEYTAYVTPDCEDGCELRSPRAVFHTGCNTYENNDSPQNAKPIAFEDIIITEMGEDDVDYFKFTPICNAIVVDKFSAEELYEDYGVTNFLMPEVKWQPYSFYKNGVKIPKSYLDDNDGNPFTSLVYYEVVPGEEYQVRFEGNNQSCYAFKIAICDACFEHLATAIKGPAHIELSGTPVVKSYTLNAVPSSVTWTVTGPAEIISDEGDRITMEFYQVGEVVLEALSTRCEGIMEIFTKTISITGENPVFCMCNEENYLSLGPITSPGDGSACYRNVIANGLDCPGNTFHWNFTVVSAGMSYTYSQTTSENTVSFWSDNWESDCIQISAEVYATCENGSSLSFYGNFSLCWPAPHCEEGGDGTGGGLYRLREEKELSTAIRLYPSPNPGEKLTVSWTNHSVRQLKLFDLNGQLLGSYKVSILSDFLAIDLQNFSAGIYFLKLVMENGVEETKRFSILR